MLGWTFDAFELLSARWDVQSKLLQLLFVFLTDATHPLLNVLIYVRSLLWLVLDLIERKFRIVLNTVLYVLCDEFLLVPFPHHLV